MKLRFKAILGISIGVFAALVALGYWYVFIEGAPQIGTVPQEDKRLKFHLETFDSQAMGEVRTYGVILPPGYTQHPQRRYPVIFLLHGGHDDASAWEKKYGASSVLHALYKNQSLPPSIVITPDGNDHRGSSPLWDPQYYDGPNGNLDTMIGSELVQVVKSRYRTLNSPQFWAIGGLSSGGWGAVTIGLKHLDNFNILFSHSGYFTDSSGPANSPEQIVQQLPIAQRQKLRIYLDVGQGDPKFLASTEQFHQTLDDLGISNVFHVFPGGHGLSGPDVGWNFFHKHLADSLKYVGEQFKIALNQQTSQVKH